MATAETITKILDYHRPDGWRAPMVYSVWEDGEITLEKGGDLFGRRTLHCVALGRPAHALPVNALPAVNSDGKHSRIYVESSDDAEAVQRLIFGS